LGSAIKIIALAEFAVGIEAAQIIVVFIVLIISYVVRFRFSKRDLAMSAFIIGVVLPMIIEMKFGEINGSKKLNRYDKAYLRIATEWGVCPIVNANK
jgi:hypothetical protein